MALPITHEAICAAVSFEPHIYTCAIILKTYSRQGRTSQRT
jgi:hypothetical protein